MRFLSFHCESFSYDTTERSRSPIYEELNEGSKEGHLDNVIVLFISVEKKDESDESILENTKKEIKSICSQLKVKNIILLSFAHLFAQLSSPKFALNTLKQLETNLVKDGFTTIRPPFGWFNELEIKAKGHPLSRISRRI
jgi:threonyl-tRNA synthetase